MRSEHTFVRLGDYVDLTTGFPFKSNGYSSEESAVRLLRGDNVAQGVLRWEDAKRWPQSGSEDVWTYALSEDDVVLAMDRPWIAAGLKFAHVRASDLPCLLVQRVARLRAKSGLDSRFLRYVIGGRRFTDYILSVQTGTAVPHISSGQIAAFEFLLPPMEEQQVIGDLLGKLDDRIDLLRQTNATLESIAQALFKSWFIDFDPVRALGQGREPEGLDAATAALFPAEFEESALGVIPKGWVPTTLADLASFQNGFAFKSKDWKDAGHPVVKIGDVRPGFVDLSGCSCVADSTVLGLDKFKLSRGDLLVGMTGYVGETGLVTQSDSIAYLNQRVGKISTQRGVADMGFVYCAVRDPAYKAFAESKSHGSAQANISGAALLSYSVIRPIHSVLGVFNGLLQPIIESLLVNHERSLLIGRTRDTLLPRLISGKLRLTEAREQVEEVLG